MPMSKRAGFTLLEAVIVLTIVGLIAGGIMVGQSIIRAADINGMLSDVAKYSAAFTDFRDKYQALPGDMSNAESFWGAPGGGCPASAGTAEGEVCNGNGDGLVYHVNDAANQAELLAQWVELANAGFISGTYVYLGTATYGWFTGTNAPITSLNGATFMFFFGSAAIFGSAIYSTEHPYNVHWLALGYPVDNVGPLKPTLSGEEGFGVDRKVDDGHPGRGIVRGGRNSTTYGFSPSCQTTDVAGTAEYNRAASGEVCIMLFALSQ